MTRNAGDRTAANSHKFKACDSTGREETPNRIVETRRMNPTAETDALTSPDSLSWQVFKNPVAMFVGGIAAGLLELAEPRVRTGV